MVGFRVLNHERRSVVPECTEPDWDSCTVSSPPPSSAAPLDGEDGIDPTAGTGVLYREGFCAYDQADGCSCVCAAGTAMTKGFLLKGGRQGAACH